MRIGKPLKTSTLHDNNGGYACISTIETYPNFYETCVFFYDSRDRNTLQKEKAPVESWDAVLQLHSNILYQLSEEGYING